MNKSFTTLAFAGALVAFSSYASAVCPAKLDSGILSSMKKGFTTKTSTVIGDIEYKVDYKSKNPTFLDLKKNFIDHMDQFDLAKNHLTQSAGDLCTYSIPAHAPGGKAFTITFQVKPFVHHGWGHE